MTDLEQLKSIADWLSEGRELPSSGDVACIFDAIEEIESLRKQWKPMSIAPKTGEKILLSIGDDVETAVYKEYMYLAGPVIGEWVIAEIYDETISVNEHKPDGWMPLPEPPKPIDEKTGEV